MKTFFTLIRVGLIMLLVIAFVWLFVSTVVEIRVKEVDRASVEISNGIMHNTADMAVFTIQELDSYKDTVEEPYFRHCRFGYLAEITDLVSDEKWVFGYKNENDDVEIDSVVAESIREFPVSIRFHDTVIPANLKLTVTDSWLTRASCLAEKASLSGNPHSILIPCIKSQGGRCVFNLRHTVDNGVSAICYDDGGDTECRHLDIQMDDFIGQVYDASDEDMATLTAQLVSGRVRFSVVSG